MRRLLTALLFFCILYPCALLADWPCRSDSCVCISSDGGNQWNVHLVSDGHSGSIMVWQDRRDGTADKLYIQRTLSTGKLAWQTGGIQLCVAPGLQYYPDIIGDGSGGAFIVWQDNHSGLDCDVFAQSIGPDGASLWNQSGVAVCNAAGHQYNPQVIPDGLGGV